MRLCFFILLLLLIWYCDAKRKRKSREPKHGPKHVRHGPKHGHKHDHKDHKHNKHEDKKEYEKDNECEEEYDDDEYGKHGPGKHGHGKHGHGKHGPGKHGHHKYKHGKRRRSKHGYKIKCPPKTTPSVVPTTNPPVNTYPPATKEVPQTTECGIAKLANKYKEIFPTFTGALQAKEGHYPWHVSIYYRGVFTCSGTLVSSNKVVTSANCFNFIDKEAKNFQVTCGDYTLDEKDEYEQTIGVSKISIHEKYDEEYENNEHDIAVITLVKNVIFTKYVTPICLPKSTDEEVKPGRRCYVTGWGESNGQTLTLQEYEIPVRESSVCNQRNKYNANTVNENMVCGVYFDSSIYKGGCRGDGGSPLIVQINGRWTIHGISSWGSPSCSGINRFTVFTRVSKYTTWVENC